MSNPRHHHRRQRWARFRRACRHLFNRALKWTILSYGFISVYGALYGSKPAIIHRLGTTLAALAAGFAMLFISLIVVSKLASEASGWLYDSVGESSMGNADDRPDRSADGRPLLQRYLVRAGKVYLCVMCWIGIVTVLLIYGPPAMNLPTTLGPLYAGETVDATFGILLSAGTATFLTLVLIIGVVSYTERHRNESADRQQSEGPDSTGDEIHA